MSDFVTGLEQDLQDLGVSFDHARVQAFADDLSASQEDRATVARRLREFMTSHIEVGSRVAFRDGTALYGLGARRGRVIATTYTAREFLEGRTPFPPVCDSGLGRDNPALLDTVCPIVLVEPFGAMGSGVTVTAWPSEFRVIAGPGDPPAN